MVRTYLLQSGMNKGKRDKVLSVLEEYRILCGKIAKLQWYNFFKKGEKFNRNIDLKPLQSTLSERYKRNSAYQVVGCLNSFLSNVQNKFKEIVYGSKLSEETRKHLFQINKRQIWLSKEHELFSSEELFLAKKIFKQILGWRRKPNFEHQNMLLNSNVAKIFPVDKTKTTEFDFWVQLSTLQSGKPIMLPLKSNKYFDEKAGEICEAIQINVNKRGELTTSLMKEMQQQETEFKEEKIAIDIGLRTLFALNNGELYGRNFIDRLKHYDNIITKLAKNRQQQGFKTRSKRYDLLVFRFRAWIKNEVNRTLNRIWRKHKPKGIVIENLNFSHPDLSKQMNRLLRNFGKSIIEEKLKSLEENYGTKITKINPAYTSQTCADCGYVSKENRKAQDKFECENCNKKVHADVGGARNHFHRSSMKNITLHTHKNSVLRKLVMGFVERIPRPNSWADGLLSENPYFKEVWKI